MKVELDRDDKRLIGRRQEQLLDMNWWMGLSHQQREAITITQNANGSFASVAIDLPSNNAIAEFEYQLSKH